MNDWRAIAALKPHTEPCSQCGQDKPREVAANKFFHAEVCICNDCMLKVVGVYQRRMALTTTEVH